jgi:hypothetical protein
MAVVLKGSTAKLYLYLYTNSRTAPTTHLQIMSRLKISGAIAQRTLCASLRGQGQLHLYLLCQ